MNLASAITSGTTTIEGGGTVPPPPAVTGAWLSGLGYWTMKYGVLWLAGYQGTLTPPAGTVTDHITAIHVNRLVSGQRAALLSLAGPFPVGDARGFKSDAVDVLFSGPVTLEFVTENEDGSTATYTTTVTLTAPTEASVTAAEATPISTTRHQTENRGVRCVLNFTPVVNNPLWPLPITIWTNHPGGVRKHRGVYEMAGPGMMQLGAVGTKSEFDIIPPTTADESWTLTFAIGSFDEFTAPPASAKTSAAFTVLQPPAPGTTDATGAYVDAITYAAGPGGASMFGLPHIYVTLPLGSNNFLHGRLMLQTGTGTGGSFVPGGKHPTATPVGDWVSDDDHAEGFFRVGNTNQIYCQVPNVWDVPSDGNTTHRLWWVVASRRNGGTEVQQNCWSSGVGVSTPGTAAYQDVVVDGTMSQISTGHGTIPDGHGGVRLNTENLANLLFNGGFETGLPPWQKLLGTEVGLQSGSFAFSGSNYFVDTMTSGGGIKQEGVSCRAGDEFYAECYLNAGFGTVSGSVFLSLLFMDAAGSGLGNPFNALGLTSGMGWTKLSVAGTAPAGASTVRVSVQIGAASGTGYWYIDNVFLSRQVPTGPGTEPDGRGGVRSKLGANLTDDGSGGTIVKPGSLGEAVFLGSSLGQDLSKWDSAKRPFGFYNGLPSPFDANVPKTIINMAESPWRVYVNTGGTWTSLKTQPGDLVGGAITALVSLTSPTISGGSISGTSLVITSGTKTIQIDGSNFIKVTDSSNGWVTQIFGAGVQVSGGGAVAIMTPFGVSATLGSASAGLSYAGVTVSNGAHTTTVSATGVTTV